MKKKKKRSTSIEHLIYMILFGRATASAPILRLAPPKVSVLFQVPAILPSCNAM